MRSTASFKIMYLMLEDGQYNRNIQHVLIKQIQLVVDAVYTSVLNVNNHTLLRNHTATLQ